MGDGLEGLKSLYAAAKGQKDLLAFLGVVSVTAILLTQKVPTDQALIFAGSALAGWIFLRFALVKIHSKERLQDFRERAKLESLSVLAKHGTKADIRAMIEELTKDEDRSE